MKHTSIPFWSWNDKLEKDRLLEQIEWMKKESFGGFMMHARSGLKTEYLSDEWFDCIRFCVEKAKELGMQAWIYDENGWPSGFVGGKLLENEEFRERYLSHGIGAYDENAILHYDLDFDDLRLTSDKSTKNCLNIYETVSNSHVDVLNGEVVDAFIQSTHERYKEELGGKLEGKVEGFFTDEPQYSRVGVPLPKKITEYFKENYGQDPIPLLGHLFVKKDGYRKFRYCYWKGCQYLLLNNFAKKVYTWCDQNGVKLIGHYVEERNNYWQMMFNAGIMPFYEFMHYPGIDWLCRSYMNPNAVRQLASVVAQLGKKYSLTETFAMTGWDVTPRELKNIADYQYLLGCNLMCHHLVPYSETENRKYDHPAHFTPFNPWCEDSMKDINVHFDMLGEWLRQGKEPVRVGVLHPIRSAYFEYEYGKSKLLKELDGSFESLGEQLHSRRIAYHLIDETLLAKHGKVNGNKLVVGECEYDYLVFPKVYTMDKTTEQFLRSYVKAGGKVCLTDGKPTYLEGDPFDYDYLNSNITLDEIEKSNPYTVKVDGEMYTALNVVDGKKYVFALNKTDKELKFNIIADGQEFNAEYDVQTGKTKFVGKDLMLEGVCSKVFCYTDQEESVANSETIYIADGKYDLESFSDNYLTLDFASYSFDGINYSEKVAIVGIFQTLLQKRYEGKVYLKKNFDLRYLPNKLQLMAENPESIKITVNGSPVLFSDRHENEQGFKLADISKFAKLGDNEIVCEYYFYQKESVYFALYGKNVGESLKNALLYDTRIEPMYLRGDFGVYSSSFEKGKQKNVWTAKDFYVDTPKKQVENIITDGFPFFAGKIKLKKEFCCDGGKTKLHFSGRIHAVEVYVNGKRVDKVLFTDQLDVTNFVVKGKNVAEFIIYTGNRNLLGPHHESGVEESFGVGPHTFEKTGWWEEFKCHDYVERYTFMRFGFFD